MFHVEDILGMAQLKSGKFRKVINKFNVKTAVEEIMHIQKFSSDLRNIKMSVDFLLFPSRELLSSDSRNLGSNQSLPVNVSPSE